MTAKASGTTVSPTTTSAVYVVIPEMTVTLTTIGKGLLVTFVCSFTVNNGDNFTIELFEDGVAMAGTEQRCSFFGGSLLGLTPANLTSFPATLVGVSFPAAGSHTYTARWKVTAGTARAETIRRQIIAVELL